MTTRGMVLSELRDAREALERAAKLTKAMRDDELAGPFVHRAESRKHAASIRGQIEAAIVVVNKADWMLDE